MFHLSVAISFIVGLFWTFSFIRFDSVTVSSCKVFSFHYYFYWLLPVKTINNKKMLLLYTTQVTFGQTFFCVCLSVYLVTAFSLSQEQTQKIAENSCVMETFHLNPPSLLKGQSTSTSSPPKGGRQRHTCGIHVSLEYMVKPKFVH